MSKYNSTDVHCLATSWTLVITQSSGNRQAAIGSPQASQFSSNHKVFYRQSSVVLPSKCHLIVKDQTYLQPHYGNGVFGNVTCQLDNTKR